MAATSLRLHPESIVLSSIRLPQSLNEKINKAIFRLFLIAKHKSHITFDKKGYMLSLISKNSEKTVFRVLRLPKSS